MEKIVSAHTSALLLTQHTGLTIAAAATEGSTQLAVLVGEIEDRLGQVGGLDDAADFDSAFFLDEFADSVEEFRRELVSVSQDLVESVGVRHTSEYHRYCQAMSRINAPSIPLVSFRCSYSFSTPRMALGENRTDRQFW